MRGNSKNVVVDEQPAYPDYNRSVYADPQVIEAGPKPSLCFCDFYAPANVRVISTQKHDSTSKSHSAESCKKIRVTDLQGMKDTTEKSGAKASSAATESTRKKGDAKKKSDEAEKYSFIRKGRADCSVYEQRFSESFAASDLDLYDSSPKQGQEVDMRKLEAYFSETNMDATEKAPATRKKSTTSVTNKNATPKSSRTKTRETKKTSRDRKSKKKKISSQEFEKPASASSSNVRVHKGIGIFSLLKGESPSMIFQLKIISEERKVVTMTIMSLS
ncbi:hypothetical protein DICVIV_10153 [Dictyocaulus viviparus]|uniref:Uncharacterized protein n=1 Tax=Dictyocaulus viviparus TaxID=29172 RepID=A0A0D8XJ89_DICVI|nr:hypothetical protein DICVIV_10153 [Dictyocaulus viviparus]